MAHIACTGGVTWRQVNARRYWDAWKRRDCIVLSRLLKYENNCQHSTSLTSLLIHFNENKRKLICVMRKYAYFHTTDIIKEPQHELRWSRFIVLADFKSVPVSLIGSTHITHFKPLQGTRIMQVYATEGQQPWLQYLCECSHGMMFGACLRVGVVVAMEMLDPAVLASAVHTSPAAHPVLSSASSCRSQRADASLDPRNFIYSALKLSDKSTHISRPSKLSEVWVVTKIFVCSQVWMRWFCIVYAKLDAPPVERLGIDRAFVYAHTAGSHSHLQYTHTSVLFTL